MLVVLELFFGEGRRWEIVVCPLSYPEITVRRCVRGWWKREMAIIIPPLKEGLGGRVWILVEVGRWNISTWRGLVGVRCIEKKTGERGKKRERKVGWGGG